MAIELAEYETPSGVVIPKAYGLITGFRLLPPRMEIEVELSIYKDANAVGYNRVRVGSASFLIGPDDPDYIALFGPVKSKVEAYIHRRFAGSKLVPSVAMGGLITRPPDQPGPPVPPLVG